MKATTSLPDETDDDRAITIVRTLHHLKRQHDDALAAHAAATAAADEAAEALRVAERRYYEQQVLYVREFGIHFGHIHSAREQLAAAEELLAT